MGNTPCKICRDDNEKELEIQPDKRGEKENTPRLESLKINLSNPSHEISNDPNNYNIKAKETPFIYNVDFEKIKCHISESISENVPKNDEGEEFSDSESQDSYLSYQDEKIYNDQNNIISVSEKTVEHCKIKDPNNNSDQNSIIKSLVRHGSKKKTAKIYSCVTLQEKDKLFLYNTKDNPLKIESINISKIEYDNCLNLKEPEAEPGEPEAEIDLKISVDTKFNPNYKKVNFAKSGNFSNLNACIHIYYKLLLLAGDGTINQSLMKSADYKYKKSKENSSTSFLKKSAYGKDSLNAWKAISIISFISENKLLNCDEDEILFQSELLKYTYNKMYMKSAQLYSSKFCVLTKSELKSKEAFLMLQNPINSVPLFCIIDTNRLIMNMATNINNKKKMYNFYISMEFDQCVLNRDKEFSRIGEGAFVDDQKKFEENQINENDTRLKEIVHGEEDKAAMKMQKRSVSKGNAERNEEFLRSTNVMVFASENDELINRWVCIVNYFITK